MGQRESLFREVLRYVGFGPADEAALRALHPVARPHFREIADAFYDRILEHEHAAAVLRGPQQVERLKVSLAAWMDRLLAGPWDEEYFELRSRIGRRHVRVKLPQRYMFTAMSVLRLHLLDIARDHFADEPEQLWAINRALSRLLDCELAIMLESYREDTLARVQRLERIERDLLEHRLEISEERYDAVVESAEALIIVMDRDDRVVLFNRKAEEVSGFTRAEMIGRPCLEILVHDEDRAMAEAAVGAALIGQGPPPFDGRIMTHDGEQRWIRWHMTTLPAPGGAQACAMGVDVTEERQLAERTRRAERLAGLGTLAAGLAHEIRNPLNAAQLQLQVLERRLRRAGLDVEDSGVSGASDLIREELRRLSDMVQDFLAFARPSELKIESADLSATVRAVAEVAGRDARERGVELVVSAQETVAANYDAERLRQVLLNLVQNGVQAAGDGGEVVVSVERSGDAAVVEVRDSGPGLPEGINVFEPFSTTKEEGTGLGLPIVHRIISDHGGDVTVRRLDGRTVFRVELPIDGPP